MNDNEEQGDAAETKPVDEVQEAPAPTASEETAGLPSDDSGVRERSDHTAEMAENQGKGGKDEQPAAAQPAPPPGPVAAPKRRPVLPAAQYPTAEERLDARIRDIEALLVDREGHQMRYVFEKWPLPYYKQWKEEANLLVALLVGLKHRRRQMRSKAG